MLSSPIGRLRLIAMLEGLSFLLLLGVAMPMKYMAEQPLGVKVLGPVHGALFVLMGLMCVNLVMQEQLAKRHAAMAMLASLLPFGPFVFDRTLRGLVDDSAE